MNGDNTHLTDRIQSGKQIVVVEIAPPKSGDAEEVHLRAQRYAGHVHALGISDNRDGVRMAALAAASIVVAEGVEPVVHIVTRDRNRIALIAEYLGAQAMGIRNLLCTSGTHQTLGICREARNVFDVDVVQLLQIYGTLCTNGSSAPEALCLGAAASPYADPLEMQVTHLMKKVSSGAKFLVTQPVFDHQRFETWWDEVRRRGLHEKVAVLAGVRPLTGAEEAEAYAKSRPSPMVPEAVIKRLASKADKASQQAVGIEIATETIQWLSGLEGLRGFEIQADDNDEGALELIGRSGLGTD